MQSKKTFRLFISSTFNDLREERNILQNEVFPEIKLFCKSYGYNFEPIDLRWGVSSEAGLDHKAMEICINEVEKVFNYPKPNFLIMLGNRYGWIPVPTEIEDKHYEKLLDKANSDEQILLEKWYKKDNNSIPATYILQPIDSILGNGNEKFWFEQDEKQLVKIIIKYKNIFPDNLHIGKSATEQEIIRGVLDSAQKIQSKDDSVLCMVRNITNTEQIDNPIFLEDNQVQLNNLKENLKNCREPHVEYKELEAKLIQKGDLLKPDKEYLEDYAIEVKRFLKFKILNEINRLASSSKNLEDEIHEKFKDERSKIFIGRESILETINQYVSDNSTAPLVIYGESGVGKSAFMAKLISSLENTKKSMNYLYRFVGISEISSQPKLFLDNLIVEIAQRLNQTTKETSKDYSDSINRFINILNQYSSKSTKKLLLIIDALDQFETKTSLEWIESELPKNIKIVVSTLPSEYGEYYDILKTKEKKENIFPIEKLNLSEGKSIIDYWLIANNKQLTKDQLDHILKLFDKNGLPLYLKIIFDQALSWKSYDYSYKQLDDETLIDAIRSYFNNLVTKQHQARILVDHTIGYISASKNGLSENEVVEILSSDHIVMQDISNPYHKLPSSVGTDKLPSAVWSRLYYDLLKYFTFVEFDGESLINFYHRKIKECARDYYYMMNKEFYHTNLLEYFWNQPTKFIKTDETNLRKISELPYHCIQSNSYSKFLDLYDLDFIDLKVNTGHKEYMLDDLFQMSIKILKNKELNDTIKNEFIEDISFALFTFLVDKIKDSRSDIINVEDIHAKFMFQSDTIFYNKFLENIMDDNKIIQKFGQDKQAELYLTSFKARKANLLRRDAKLVSAMDIYNDIIESDAINDLHNLEQSTIFYDVGTISYLRGDYNSAIKFMNKSVEVAGDLNNKISKYMSLVKLGQIKFVYLKDYDFFETILNEAFQHFWKFRFESFSARRFVRGNYALYFDLYYAKEDLIKSKEFLEKFKNDNSNIYKSIYFIPKDKSLYEKSKCTGYTPYEARIKILEGKYEEAADMFSRYLNIFMNEDDRNTLEFIAKEYYDYLLALKQINNTKQFEIEKEKALKLPDEPLNAIWKERINLIE